MYGDAPTWKLIEQISAAPRRVLDEADFVRAALKFANEGSFRALAMQVSGLPIPDGPVGDPGWQLEADRIARENYAAEREQFRSDLERIIARSTDAAFSTRINAGVNGHLFLIPQFKGSMVGHHFVVKGLSAVTCYAAKLFLDRDLPYGKDLHRCQWGDCPKFFMTSDAQKRKKRPTGLPRKKYCSNECMFKERARRRKEK
jgi:hypothetical protein